MLIDRLALLVRVLAVAGVAGGIAALTRALPWPPRLLTRKPWSCPVCWVGHATWVAMLVLAPPGEWAADWRIAVATYFAALALAIWFYKQAHPPEVTF